MAQVSSPFSLTTNPNLQTQTALWRLTTHFLESSQCVPTHGSTHVFLEEHDSVAGHSEWVWHGKSSGIRGRIDVFSSQLGSEMQCLSGRPTWHRGQLHRAL